MANGRGGSGSNKCPYPVILSNSLPGVFAATTSPFGYSSSPEEEKSVTNVSINPILTVAWTGTLCTNPPMCYISVRPERHSYEIIQRNMEFVINLTTHDMARATDWCGVRSGRDYNKFQEMGLTPGPCTMVSAPLIEESPLCIECRVKEILSLGSHDMFIADVVNVRADDKYLNPDTGKFELSHSNPLVYVHGNYYDLGTHIGKFGWSVEKKKKS